jgi:hypothetical protein
MFDLIAIYPNAVWPKDHFTEKYHSTESFFQKVVSPKKMKKAHLTENKIWKLSYFTEMKWSFARNFVRPKDHLTEKKIGKWSFNRKVIRPNKLSWPKGLDWKYFSTKHHLSENVFFVKGHKILNSYLNIHTASYCYF